MESFFYIFQPTGPMEKLTHIELTDIQCEEAKPRSFDVNSIVFQVCLPQKIPAELLQRVSHNHLWNKVYHCFPTQEDFFFSTIGLPLCQYLVSVSKRKYDNFNIFQLVSFCLNSSISSIPNRTNAKTIHMQVSQNTERTKAGMENQTLALQRTFCDKSEVRANSCHHNEKQTNNEMRNHMEAVVYR